MHGKLGNFYKYINHKLNGSSGIGPLLNSSGEIEHSAHAKATVFPRIEAPGLYLYNYVRPPACIRGPACIQGPASISTFTSRRTDGDIRLCVFHRNNKHVC